MRRYLLVAAARRTTSTVATRDRFLVVNGHGGTVAMTSAARWLMMCALAVGAALGPIALPARAVALPAQASAPQSAPSAQRTPFSDLPPDRVPILSGVSCPSTSRCLAVGSIFRPAAGFPDYFPSSLIWNGRSWRALRTPGGASLTAVSCATATGCVAVGAQVALAWNGTRWRTLKPALKPGRAITLTGVSCQAASRCMAVGFWGSEFAAAGTVAEAWNGTRWRLLSTPDPAGAATSSLAGVSCASAARCVAVGESLTSDRVVHPLAESWNGHSWTILATADWTGGFTSVSCASISQCMAVGQAGSVAADATLAQEWNGTSWRLLTTVNDETTSLGGVWCTSASACIAVGSVLGAGVTKTGEVPLAQEWDGASWRLLNTVSPVADIFGINGLASISCPGPARCMAVGTVESSGSLAEEWDGTRWTVRRTNHVDALQAISCTRISHCLAVGAFINGTDELAVLTQTWNGHLWRTVRSPGLLGELSAVSCLSASRCVAVGGAPGPSGDGTAPLAVLWNGRTWHVMPTTSLPRGQLGAVSCASASFCIATGFSKEARWDGHSWQPTAIPAPAGSFKLSGVSCTSSARCIAVGTIFPGAHASSRTLAAAWNGTAWRILTTPNLSAFDNALTTVSCTHLGCMAVGGYQDRNGVGHNLALRWTGTRWRIVKIGGPPVLQSVSCPAASSCMAIGNYLTGRRLGSLSGHNLAEVWNGRTWRIIPTAGPGGLASTSCTTPLRCMAVGQTRTLTMAETWNGLLWQLLRTPNP